PPPQPAASTRNLARQGQQRAAAASVFAAKQHPTRSRNTLTILVIAMLLLLPLGGGVLWYLQSTPSSSIGINPNIANYDLSSRSLGGNDVDGTGAAANPPPVTTTQIPEPPETESPSEPTAN